MVRIDGVHLSGADIRAVAERRQPVQLDPTARARAERSFAAGAELAAARPVYGRTTGVGANRSVAVPEAGVHALALLRSHATSAGPLRSAERVRALLAVRLNQLAAGGSGASPAVLDGLAAMLVADALPPVREAGSLGTGDLAALATTALALLGELPTSRPLPTRVTFGPHDALPFLSSNAATIADAVLAGGALAELARAGVVVAGLSFAAVQGNPEAYAVPVESVTPFPGARQACRWLRRLTAGLEPPRRIQDSYGLRALPQVHGAALDALAALELVTGRLANAPSENPVVLPDAGLAHHGGFHAAYLGLALDAARLAVAQAAQLGLARLTGLVEPAVTGLPAYLSDGPPGASGVMLLEYVAADALGELRALATPAGLQSVVLSRGVEEDASFAALAARQALRGVTALRTVLACELVAAVRALRLRGGLPAGSALGAALQACAELPPELGDRDLTPDLSLAGELLPGLAGRLPQG